MTLSSILEHTLAIKQGQVFFSNLEIMIWRWLHYLPSFTNYSYQILRHKQDQYIMHSNSIVTIIPKLFSQRKMPDSDVLFEY